MMVVAIINQVGVARSRILRVTLLLPLLSASAMLTFPRGCCPRIFTPQHLRYQHRYPTRFPPPVPLLPPHAPSFHLAKGYTYRLVGASLRLALRSRLQVLSEPSPSLCCWKKLSWRGILCTLLLSRS